MEKPYPERLTLARRRAAVAAPAALPQHHRCQGVTPAAVRPPGEPLAHGGRRLALPRAGDRRSWLRQRTFYESDCQGRFTSLLTAFSSYRLQSAASVPIGADVDFAWIGRTS